MDIFRYGQVEIDHLKRRDKKLGAAIDRLGVIERQVDPDVFTALLRSIVSQQISGKARDTIWSRLHGLLGAFTPEAVGGADPAALQACGLSWRKVEYLQGIARAALDGQVDFAGLPALADQEVVAQLTALHGVGVWTAEMLLLFSLQRPDVVSWGDLAIRRGMVNLYGLEKLTREQFERYRKRYSPYGSVASLYLWKVSAE